MPGFNYTAINELGRQVRGNMIAENELDLEERLKNNNLDLISYRMDRKGKGIGRGKVKNNDLIIMCLHMEQLDRAGVTLHEALADIRDSTESKKLREIMADVYENVKTGKLLSEALANYPNTFNEVFVGLIEAGEKTGDLGNSFMHLGNHIKWVAEIQRKVKKAIRYPMVLLVIICLVITVLMTFVVPKLIDFITSQGFTIPVHTKALIAVSEAFVEYWYLMFGTPILTFILLFISYKKSEKLAYFFDNIFLNSPIFGSVIRKIEMARFTHFFSIMFNSGIDILDSLSGAKNVVHNRVVRESIMLARQRVTEGNTLTSSIKLSGQFPTLVIRMFKVGEDSGNMREALENINFFYDREVNDAVESLVGMIQPTMTVVMGALIFWIIAAVFGPLYESFSNIDF